jgi:hypothetical protein
MDTMDALTPTPNEFRNLYEAALAFKELAPWECMFEDEVFGVRSPETDQIGYASVMGTLGEHLALGVYLGSEGLFGFYELSADDTPDIPDLLLETPHVQASFEDREVLSDKDRQVIKSLGLRFRGRQAWPMFRSYAPGYLPWYLTAGEARFLTMALQQSLEVAIRLKENPSLLDPPQPEQLLVRSFGDGGWIDEWAEPAPVQVRLPAQLHEESVAALQQQLVIQPWKLEVDLYGLSSIREREGGRPYLGHHLLIVESTSGFIAGGDLLLADPSFEEMWVQVPRRVVEAAIRLGGLPAEIVVRREKLHHYLAPTAGQLGIKVSTSDRLPALDQVRRELERRM